MQSYTITHKHSNQTGDPFDDVVICNHTRSLTNIAIRLVTPLMMWLYAIIHDHSQTVIRLVTPLMMSLYAIIHDHSQTAIRLVTPLMMWLYAITHDHSQT